jgi:hypothetical protein
VNPRRSTHLLCGQLHVRAAVSDDEAIGGLASRQRGVVSRGQLLELGVSGRAIDHRLSVGRLRRLFPGVYAVGHGALAFPGRMVAAVAATAPGAAASHLSAAALWGLAEPPEGWPHVTVARSRRARRGLVIHGARLPEEDRTIVSGIPATRVPRTMLDLSATLGKPALRRLISEAEFMGLTCVADLEAILTRYPRRRGRRTLAEIVEANLEGAGRTRSELEDRFLELCRRSGFPMPETNVPVEARGQRFEVDCAWRDARVIVELDGYRAHGRGLAFQRDRARDRALIASGWIPMRVTWAQLQRDEPTVAAEIRDTLARRWREGRFTHAPGG